MDPVLIQLLASGIGVVVGLLGLLTAIIQLKRVARETQKDQQAEPKKRWVWKALGYAALALILVAGVGIGVSSWWQSRQAAAIAPSPGSKSIVDNPTTPKPTPDVAARPTEERPSDTSTFELGSHYGLGITHNRGSVYEYRALSGAVSVKPVFGEVVARCTKMWRSNRGGGQYIFTTCDDEKANIEVRRFD